MLVPNVYCYSLWSYSTPYSSFIKPAINPSTGHLCAPRLTLYFPFKMWEVCMTCFSRSDRYQPLQYRLKRVVFNLLRQKLLSDCFHLIPRANSVMFVNQSLNLCPLYLLYIHWHPKPQCEDATDSAQRLSTCRLCPPPPPPCTCASATLKCACQRLYPELITPSERASRSHGSRPEGSFSFSWDQVALQSSYTTRPAPRTPGHPSQPVHEYL